MLKMSLRDNENTPQGQARQLPMSCDERMLYPGRYGKTGLVEGKSCLKKKRK